MKHQIVKMDVNGITYTVVQDTQVKINPLSVYKSWMEYRGGTYPLKHRKLLVRYQDLNSCMCRIMSDINHKEMVIVEVETFATSNEDLFRRELREAQQ